MSTSGQSAWLKTTGEKNKDLIILTKATNDITTCLDICEITTNCNSINFEGTICTLHKTYIVAS